MTNGDQINREPAPATSNGGAEALIEAARAGDERRVRDLLRGNPAVAGMRSASGETPLMAALYHRHEALAGELADAMQRAGQPLDVFGAAALGRVEALDAALASGADVNACAHDGWTPLHLAAFFGRREAAERLLAAGADIIAVSRNSLQNTPLHAAIAGGHEDVSLLLVHRGADVNAADAGRHTPLHLAAEAGYAGIVKALLARGGDPHLVDSEDKTPLSRAAARNHDAVVDLITEDR